MSLVNLKGLAPRLLGRRPDYPGASEAQRFLDTGLLQAFFDREHYLARNPDVAASRVDPWRHFLLHGLRERRSSHPLFDLEMYLERNQDVADRGWPPIVHYLAFGASEDRAPNRYFDAAWYRSRHAAALSDGMPPLLHYIHHAREPDFDPNPYFDSAWYARTYLAGDPQRNPLEHFLTEGEREGLSPHPLFDSAEYLSNNPDVERLLNDRHTPWAAYQHFYEHGAKDLSVTGTMRRLHVQLGEIELDFEEPLYLDDNPDVVTLVQRGDFSNGTAHFFSAGWREAQLGLRSVYSPARQPKVRRRVPGKAQPRTNRYLALYAHYDKDDQIDDYVIEGLKRLNELGIDVIFITATESDSELARAAPYVLEFIIKTEAGRDFGSWRLALECTEYMRSDYDSLILINDSCYFPVSDPSGMLLTMESRGFNYWGITDSREFNKYHIQSYFLVFDKKAREILIPQFILRYDRNIHLAKFGQIAQFEVGLTQMAMQAGLSVGALCAIDDIREDVLRESRLKKWKPRVERGVAHVNSTHSLWDLLLLHYNCPILKIELVRDNPLNVAQVENFSDYIDRGWFDPQMIKRHLRRMRKGASRRPTEAPAITPTRQYALPRVELIERIPGNARQTGERMVLFAHYDPDGIVDPYILYQLHTLNRAGSAVTFVSSTRSSRELAKVRPLACEILVKNDAGRDFGSWWLAIRTLRDELNRHKSVVWMNDSTYFPLFDPAEMFSEMGRRSVDFWGVIDSQNLLWHIMSWFWVFDRKLIQTGWFDWFENEYNPAYSKWEQIRNYEIRIPTMLVNSGASVSTYITSESVRKAAMNSTNDRTREDAQNISATATHDFWDILIRDFRCPSLKVELVRDNPLGIDLSKLFELIEAETTYDPTLILNHIRRLKSRRPEALAVK